MCRAVEVQAERLEDLPEEERESYADEFSSETVKLLDEILAQPRPWLDIGDQEKRQRITDIQARRI